MDVMKRWSGWSLWALFLACAPGLLESQDDCELKELVVGEARGRAGERVEVELLGSASCEVTGFILAIGHDTSRLSFVDAAPGEVLLAHAGDDLFFGFDAQNAQGYAVVGAVFDLSFPLTVPPTAIPAGTLLATLNYEILPGAAPGVTRLLNRTRTYGPGNPVSNVYSRRPGEPPLEPRLVDGAVTIEGQGAVIAPLPRTKNAVYPFYLTFAAGCRRAPTDQLECAGLA